MVKRCSDFFFFYADVDRNYDQDYDPTGGRGVGSGMKEKLHNENAKKDLLESAV
jgi:hypothetical protein